MDALDLPQLLALSAAIGWASGVRLYLVVLLTGLAGYLGWVPLPGGLQLLAHPVVIAASGFMVFIEFFAEIDLLVALSACPGGDCGASHSDDAAKCYPLKVEIYRIGDDALAGWRPPSPNGYSRTHGVR